MSESRPSESLDDMFNAACEPELEGGASCAVATGILSAGASLERACAGVDGFEAAAFMGVPCLLASN